MPRDVKEYVLRRAMNRVRKARTVSPEKQSELAAVLMRPVLTAEPGELSPKLIDELIATSFGLLGRVPLEHCATCGRPVFTHEAIKKDDKFYCCASCAGR